MEEAATVVREHAVSVECKYTDLKFRAMSLIDDYALLNRDVVNMYWEDIRSAFRYTPLRTSVLWNLMWSFVGDVWLCARCGLPYTQTKADESWHICPSCLRLNRFQLFVIKMIVNLFDHALPILKVTHWGHGLTEHAATLPWLTDNLNLLAKLSLRGFKVASNAGMPIWIKSDFIATELEINQELEWIPDINCAMAFHADQGLFCSKHTFLASCLSTGFMPTYLQYVLCPMANIPKWFKSSSRNWPWDYNNYFSSFKEADRKFHTKSSLKVNIWRFIRWRESGTQSHKEICSRCVPQPLEALVNKHKRYEASDFLSYWRVSRLIFADKRWKIKEFVCSKFRRLYESINDIYFALGEEEAGWTTWKLCACGNCNDAVIDCMENDMLVNVETENKNKRKRHKRM